MPDESPVSQPEDPAPSAIWLREFAEFYRNNTLKDVNEDYNKLLEIAKEIEDAKRTNTASA